MSYCCEIIVPQSGLTVAQDVKFYILYGFSYCKRVSPSEEQEYSGRYSIFLRYKFNPDVSIVIKTRHLHQVLGFLKDHLEECSSCSFGFFGMAGKGGVSERSWDSFDKERRKIGWNI